MIPGQERAEEQIGSGWGDGWGVLGWFWVMLGLVSLSPGLHIKGFRAGQLQESLG